MTAIDYRSRFWSKVDVGCEWDCWAWTASKCRDGYGTYGVEGKTLSAHRVSFELLRGVIASGLELDHLCGARGCVNPDHLEPVTHRENVRRGKLGRTTAARQLGKSHCPSGHAYSGENLYIWKGQRMCRTCRRASNKRASHAA